MRFYGYWVMGFYGMFWGYAVVGLWGFTVRFAVVCWAVCNHLIINMLQMVLQKTMFWPLKGGLLQPKRPPFAMQFAMFYHFTFLPFYF